MSDGTRLGVALLTVFVSGCAPSEPGAERALPADLAARSLCFSEPRLEPPSDEVRDRVAAATAHLAEPIRAWIRALMTHESAGVLDAVSPTGCAGPLAIQRCEGCTPCCVSDARDRSLRYYDRCDFERRAGFRCDSALDPRFRPGYSIDYAAERIAALQRRVARSGFRDVKFEAALATNWNAGSGVFAGYPAGLREPSDAIARLAFGTAEPYRTWAPEDLWTKIVEVYDYLRWFDYLRAYWRGEPRDAGGATASPGERCFAAASGRLAPSVRAPGRYRIVEIHRLRFGSYLPGTLELLDADGR